MKAFIFLIPLLPLISFAVLGLLNKKIPHSLVGITGCGSIFVSFVISVLIFFKIKNDAAPIEINYFEWFGAGNLNISFGFLIDRLSTVMLLVVTGVGFLIHVYSVGYMGHDEGYARFFSYMNLFVFFMLLLVMGNNYAVMFAGWEGVGLCSYLLIGFWFRNNDYNQAANKAFVMNRIGDLGFILGLFLMFQTFGSLNYSDVFGIAQTYPKGDGIIAAICVLLFIGAMGKSAQIPLYTWLPDAMAGPTPVSALIHAATMVTAGVYMVARSNILYTLSPFASEIVLVTGIATALFAATIGLKQNDIKKVLAYSTVSQLGYMFAALGVGAYSTAMFHVVTHAFFKALLFLAAGSIIHAMGGEQDIRRMGGLRKALPVTHFTFLIGTIAISGIPPFAAFFSKDEILAVVHTRSNILFTILAFTSVLTAIYMFRLYFLVFSNPFRGTEEQKQHLHESPAVMTLPLIVLAFLSTFGGFLGMPEIMHAPHYFKNFLNPVMEFSNGMITHIVTHRFEITLIITSIITLAVLIGALWMYYVKKNNLPEEDENTEGFAKVLLNKYYVDELYHSIFTRTLDWLGAKLYRIVDLNFIDGIVNAIPGMTNAASNGLRLFQSGNLGFYFFGMVAGVILIFVLMFLI
jgi:NADH-quinone oxidoreductase subunit L